MQSGKFTTLQKISKQKKAATPIETEVANAFLALESPETHDLKFLSAREFEVSPGKKAVIIVVPYVQRKAFHDQAKFIPELEKKLGGKHVVVIAKRRILPPQSRKSHVHRQKRPRSRTLTAVHDAILEDLVYPAEIIGKRLNVRVDGTRLLKVHLDNKERANFVLEHKLDTFASVYKRLTGKNVAFEFPQHKHTN